MIDGKLIKKRIVPALLMIASGALIYIGAFFYNPQESETVIVAESEEQTTDAPKAAARTLSSEKVVHTDDVWTPKPDEFNLAHYFPEGADTEEISESYGAMAFNALVRRESAWWSQVYSSVNMTPAQLAAQLGRDPSSVYSSSGEIKNFKSIHMSVINGDGTPVNLKSNIIQIMSMANVYTYYHDVEDYDAFLEYCEDLFDRSHSYSVSMSGIYYCDGSCLNDSIDSEDFDEDFFTYDTNFDLDPDSSEPLDYFYEPVYETEPPQESESGVIISGSARQAYEESLENSSIGPTPAYMERTFDEYTEDYAGSDVSVSGSETESYSYEDEQALAAAQARNQAEAETLAQAEETEAARAHAAGEAARAQAEAASQAETEALAQDLNQLAAEEDFIPETESQAPVIIAGSGYAVQSAGETESQDYHKEEWAVAEAYPYNTADAYEAASPSDAVQTEEGSDDDSTSDNSNGKCPGHIDLNISIRIYDLDGEKSLYTLDVIGSVPDADYMEETEDKSESEAEDVTEDTASSEDVDEEEAVSDETEDKAQKDNTGEKKLIWPGWGEEQRKYVHDLSSQDWYEKYGLSLSTFSFGNPLTPSEIKRYMDMLPSDLSETRRKVIEFALQSVGKVPYYYGGKASYAGYEGNNFGMLVDPDHNGRVLKGLDCSGWVGWVYWSVMGINTPYQSTSSLCEMGQAVTLNELKPGDIAVRTGNSAHVIMFLGWAEDGNILCIHESSSGVNNVTIAERAPGWPYYRSIFD